MDIQACAINELKKENGLLFFHMLNIGSMPPINSALGKTQNYTIYLREDENIHM